MKILLMFLILCLPLSAYSEGLKITGAKTTYQKDGTTLTESPDAPISPSLNDLWRDVDTNVLWKWNGSEWKCKIKTQKVQDAIDIFKANISLVNDVNARRCLKALGKIVGKLYQEVIE